MDNEYRVYGPPGTGKTTRIKEMVQQLKRSFIAVMTSLMQ